MSLLHFLPAQKQHRRRTSLTIRSREILTYKHPPWGTELAEPTGGAGEAVGASASNSPGKSSRKNDRLDGLK